jgi:hypothetical protein
MARIKSPNPFLQEDAEKTENEWETEVRLSAASASSCKTHCWFGPVGNDEKEK